MRRHFPVNLYYIKESRLLLTLYVDDILLSGPEENHQDLWKMLQKHIEIEDPTPVDNVLARRHLITIDEKGASMKLDMSDFALQMHAPPTKS